MSAINNRNNCRSDNENSYSDSDLSSEESCDNDNGKTAKYIKDKRLSDNTKSQYKIKAKHFENWIELSHPKCQTQ